MSSGSTGNQLTVEGLARYLIKAGIERFDAIDFVNGLLGFDQPAYTAVFQALRAMGVVTDSMISGVAARANCAMGIATYSINPQAVLVNGLRGKVSVVPNYLVGSNTGRILVVPGTYAYTLNVTGGVPTLAMSSSEPAINGNFVGITITIEVDSQYITGIDAIQNLYLTVTGNQLIPISLNGVRSGYFGYGTYSLFDQKRLNTTFMTESVYVECPSVVFDRISNTCQIIFQLNGDELFAAAWATWLKVAIEDGSSLAIATAAACNVGPYTPPAQAAVAALNGAVSVVTTDGSIEALAPQAIAAGMDVLGNFVSQAGVALSADYLSTYDQTVSLSKSLSPNSLGAASQDLAANVALTALGAVVASTFKDGVNAVVEKGITWFGEFLPDFFLLAAL